MNSPDHSPRTLMACIGDASRFRLVQALRGGARCVTDLAVEVGLSQSCTTRHLQALERGGVVCGVREGKRVMYDLRREEPALGPLLAWAMPADHLGQAPVRHPSASDNGRTTKPKPLRAAVTRLPVPGSVDRAPGPAGSGGGGDPQATPAPGLPPGVSSTPGARAERADGGIEPGAAERPHPHRAPRHELEDYLL